MSMHVRQSRYSSQEHHIRQASTTAPASLSIQTIVVIGVCGGLGLLLILLSILYFVKRGKQKKRERKTTSGELDETEEVSRAIRSTRPPDLDLGRRRSYLPSLGNKKKSVSNPWVDEDGLHGPPMANTKAFKPGSDGGGSHNGWPLVPLKSSAVVLNSQPEIPEESFSPSDSYPVISPPGNTAVPPLPYTKGRSYDPSLGDGNLDVAGIPRSTIRYVPYEPQKLAMKRRSTSDTHLTSILRSTSQRMRERRLSQRPLSRAHSVLSQISGAPPSQRLPSPPRHHFGETGYGDSREGLIESREKGRAGSEHSYDTSNYEAILDNFPTRRTPSPSKSVPWSADHVTGKRSLSPSAASDEDSLCNGKTPDFVIPFHLTSPSKRRPSNARIVNGDEHHPLHTYSKEEGGAKSAIEASTRIRKDSRASIQAFGGYFDIASQQKRLLSKPKDPDDPFYSGVVKSGRSPTRVNPILIGPRSPPVKSYTPKRGHSRKASTMSRSFLPPGSSIASEMKLPLSDISGNSSQGSPNKTHDQPERASKLDVQLASFQWSPEPLQLVARKTSISSIGPGVARQQHHQGHKRQNVVRMSGLPRPRSVCPVPEESEDLNYDDVFSASGLDLSKVPSVPPPLLRLHSTESLVRSASLASIYSRYSTMDSVQPPSSSVFEPRLTILPLNKHAVHKSISMNSMGSSPTLGPYHPNLNSSAQTGYGCAYPSPSMAAYNHRKLALTEETDETADDLFESPLKAKRFSKGKTRRMGRNFSIDCGTVTAKGSTFAFPPPPTPGVSSDTIGDPFSNSNIFSLPLTAPSPTTTPMAYSEPAPPLVTRLHSPHSPHRLPNSSDFLLKNITQFRRGDSTLSSYSMNSMGSTLTIGLGERDDSSHTLADTRGGSISPGKQGAEHANGSRDYINPSNPNSMSSSPTKHAQSIFSHTAIQAFQNSPSLGGRNFPLNSRSNTTSPFKSATFNEVSKSPAFGLGIDVSTFNLEQTCTENGGKVFEISEQQSDTSNKIPPSRKLKSVRKSPKPHTQQGNKEPNSGLPSSPPCMLGSNPERGNWDEESTQRSFEFENYSPLHFESLEGFRFTTASYGDDGNDDDEGYDEHDEDMISQEERKVDDLTDPRKERKAVSTEAQFQFQGIQKFAGHQHQSSGLSTPLSNFTSIPGLNLSQQKAAISKNVPGSGWDVYPQSKHTLAPSLSMGIPITPSISPMQLSYTQLGISNPSANQSTAQLHSAPTAQTNKSTEILSPIPTPTSSSHSQILQSKHQEHEILQLNYPKTSRWIWEETTPKVSPSPSPDRQGGNAVERKTYRVHSRNQSYSQNPSKAGDNGIERRMGNPLSSNPTVSSLMMAMELGMKEPRIIDLDEATNLTSTRPRVSNIENLDPKVLRVGETVEMEEIDITEAAKTTNLSPNHSNPSPPLPTSTSTSNPQPPTSTDITTISQVEDEPTPLNEKQNNKNGSAKGKGKGKTKTKTKSHLENIFSRHHKGHVQQLVEEGVVGQEKRGSLYDKEGFLKSSPAVAVEGGKSGRWGVRGKK